MRTTNQLRRKLTGWHVNKLSTIPPNEGREEAIMAKKTAIHRSNHGVGAARKVRFLTWAEKNPETAWKQAIDGKETSPWMVRALQSREGQAAAAAIRATYLTPLIEAQAKLASFPKPSPASKAAQADLRRARQRYVEVKEALEPRRRHR